ncbi:murein transglycosylase [Haloechinothrix salitolerans]|uniref:Murein transglycosylase n=1 Tax=Haloechinothrix salitolerans TaxID=926830 RepID=A0ABW2BYF3_9PSEU
MTEPAGRPRAKRSTSAGSRIAYGKIAGTVALLAAGVVLITTVGVTPPDDAPAADGTQTAAPMPGVATPESAPPAPIDRPNASDAARLTAWAKRIARKTTIPARALAAYGRTEMWMRSEAPDCRLSWATVAGIADVASEHGTVAGGRIDRDGMATTPILGPLRDGTNGMAKVPDTDDGTLDGAARWDRAVGPLQIMPKRWHRWRARATRDGKVPDPHNIDDAALTAGRILCGTKADLAHPNGWWRAVRAYRGGHDAAGFARKVFTSADRYAELAH